MTDQVNDPDTCPNVVCRSKTFDVYDEERMPDRLILKCACEECPWQWEDTYKLEFHERTDVTRG